MLLNNRRCSQNRRDHLHRPADECQHGFQNRHHVFVPDVTAIAVELSAIASLLSKAEAFDLIAALSSK